MRGKYVETEQDGVGDAILFFVLSEFIAFELSEVLLSGQTDIIYNVDNDYPL